MNISLENQNNNTISSQNQIKETGSAYSVSKSNNIYDDIKLQLKDLIENLISKKEDKTIDDEINEMFLNLDFGSEFNIDAAKIGPSDAIFFVNLLNQNNLINYSISDDRLSITDSKGKPLEVTTSLLNLLKTSTDTQKPIRLDFDNDVTVILKLDKEGKIQAHFIPGNKEVETYLKNNITSLKQTFDDENINYSSLSYSEHKENRKNKKNKGSK